MGGGKYERQIQINTDEYMLDAEIVIKDTVENPELLADKLQDHLDDCLLEFVVSQQSDNQG